MHRWSFARAGLWALDLARIGGGAPLFEVALPTLLAPQIREAGRDDVAGLASVMGHPQAEVLARMTSGRHCYVAEHDGRVAAFGWVSVGHEEIPELEGVVHPDAGEAYIWNCFTVPEYRGHGLLPALLERMAVDLRLLCLRRAWAIILAGNRSSQRAFAKVGFVEVARVTYLRLLPLRYLGITGRPGAPRSLVDAARHLLRP